MKKLLIVILSSFLLLMAFGCTRHNQKNESDPIDYVDDIEWVKAVYFDYLKEKGLLDETYGPHSADDLVIDKYVGTFGDNCVVAYMGNDNLAYTAALRPETYGENTIVYSSGQICYAFYKNQALTVGEAYKKGILTDTDIIKIDEIVGYHN